MRPHAFGTTSLLLSISIAFGGPLLSNSAYSGGIPPVDVRFDVETPTLGVSRELQLEVYVNGSSTGLIAAFRQDADGTLAIDPEQLQNVGIDPDDEAMRSDGLVEISQLLDVSFEYDEASQVIYFNAEFEALATHVIKVRKSDKGGTSEPQAQSSVGALVNYTVFGSTGGDELEEMWQFEGVSAWLEGRAFSPLGVLTSSQIVSSSSNQLYDTTRLGTTWSYSSPKTMTTYGAGDIITGGLSWTRPTRLGGVQIRRNFRLRPSIVTMPLPELSGSAAVPSTVDVYVNNARRLSQQVPPGPFQITDLPVITGSGTARVVVRDALGRETMSETPFFASLDLLAPGLWDYSAEMGFARLLYGMESNHYDGRVVGSGTVRYGVNDRLTLEGHAEGGGGLMNGGAGAVFGLGSHGITSIAGAASMVGGRTGFQVAGSIELQLWDLHFVARTQRTFSQYHDIASVTFDLLPSLSPGLDFRNVAPPRALDQISMSIPLSFDPSTFNISYTRLVTTDKERSRILGASFSRQFGKSSTFFANAFTDLDEEDSIGVFAGLSIPLGNIYGSTSASSDAKGTAVTTDLVKSERADVGSVGWRIRDTEGAYVNRAASASYRAPVARVQAGVQQYDDLFRTTAQVDGAVVFADGDFFISNRIGNAFAVVDAGVPGVDVEYENRPVGRTNSQGKLLVPNLRSYESNQITIDPMNLPIDATVGSTREVSVPADRSGTVVRFAVETGVQAALVTLRDEAGDYLEPGAAGELEGHGEGFTVGYDGQAYITGLGATNRVVVDQPTRGRCVAEFAFQAQLGKQVVIPDAVCRAIQ